MDWAMKLEGAKEAREREEMMRAEEEKQGASSKKEASADS